MPVFYPNQKLPVTEIESPEEITADSPDGFYIQEGGTSTPSGGTTIHYYNSIEQVPADLPDGSFVAVPSTESGGGLPTITLTTAATEYGAALSNEDNEIINNIGYNRFLLNITFNLDGMILYGQAMLFPSSLDGTTVFCYAGRWFAGDFDPLYAITSNYDGTWSIRYILQA